MTIFHIFRTQRKIREFTTEENPVHFRDGQNKIPIFKPIFDNLTVPDLVYLYVVAIIFPP